MGHVDASHLLITREPGLLEAEVAGEMVALHVDNGTCYGFNSMAYRIWRLLEQTLTQLCATLVRQFRIESDACEAEVRLLLDDLARDRLVTLATI